MDGNNKICVKSYFNLFSIGKLLFIELRFRQKDNVFAQCLQLCIICSKHGNEKSYIKHLEKTRQTIMQREKQLQNH